MNEKPEVKTTALVTVDMSEYGLSETRANEVKAAFDVVLGKAVELESEFNNVVQFEQITPEICAMAKAARLKYVKVRTGLIGVHRDMKAFYLSGGRAVDGLKNAYIHAVEGREAKLKEIETHFERIEAERIEKLTEERTAVMVGYGKEREAACVDLGRMPEDVWNNYIEGVRLQFEQVKAAEAKAEADRIAREKAEAEEIERQRLETERLKAEAKARDEKDAKEKAEREEIEKARLKKEADAQAERDRIEQKRIAKEKAEREEREAAERKKEAAFKAERKELEAKLAKEQAEREADVKVEREAREKLEREAREMAEAEKVARAELAAREKNTAHRKEINNAAVADVLKIEGMNPATAKAVVVAIAKGNVANVSISY
jgi:hypothetical protein